MLTRGRAPGFLESFGRFFVIHMWSSMRLLCLFVLLAVTYGAPTLDFAVANSGHFSVSLDGKKLFEGAEVVLGDKTASSGSLIPVGEAQKGSGEDALGKFESVTLKWAEVASTIAMHTSFRKYSGDGGMLVFEQFFPRDVAKSEFGNGTGSALTMFPAFDKSGVDLDCFSYHGIFAHTKACNVSNFQESHQGGAPLVIYDSKDSRLPMVVFSPLNQPKAHHMAADDKVFGAGVKATVELIPKGWSQLFLLSAAEGINAGMMAWGDRMLKFTGKARADMYKDTTHGKIGFWTVNGGTLPLHCTRPILDLISSSLPTITPRLLPLRHWRKERNVRRSASTGQSLP